MVIPTRWQEHVTLKWLYLLGTKFGIRSVCVCVGGGCLYVFCKEAKVMPFSACHQLGTRQFSAQSLLSATLNFIIKSLLSGEGEKCLIIQNTFHI